MSDTDQILDGLIEQKFREIERQLADSQSIRKAEKLILLQEIEAHTRTKAELAEAQQAREQMNREIAESLASAGKACQELAGERDTYARLLKEAEAALATVVCRGHYDTCGAVLCDNETYPCSCPWDVAREAIQMISAALAGVSEPASERCPNCTREVPCDIHDLGRCGL